MSRPKLDPSRIVPTWCRALAILDTEAITATRLRAYTEAGADLPRELKRAGLIETFPGISEQGKPCEHLRLTQAGRDRLHAVYNSLRSFLRGDDDVTEEDDDDEVTAEFPVLVFSRPHNKEFTQ